MGEAPVGRRQWSLPIVMRLLPLRAFRPVFAPLEGKRVGFVRPLGNVGDALIEAATLQLFAAFEIDYTIHDPANPVPVDQIVFGGGGNMGTAYRNNWRLRAQCLRLGTPVTILPQSFTSREDRPYHRVYVRERASLKFCPQGILTPDLALGFDQRRPVAPPGRATGVFLRKDPERPGRRRWWARDPAKLCRTPQEYLRLAARYERIITDRLHFAIAALIVGRETVLLPNCYHKNRSMWETWLADLGCRFSPHWRNALRGRWLEPPAASLPAA